MKIEGEICYLKVTSCLDPPPSILNEFKIEFFLLRLTPSLRPFQLIFMVRTNLPQHLKIYPEGREQRLLFPFSKSVQSLDTICRIL